MSLPTPTIKLRCWTPASHAVRACWELLVAAIDIGTLCDDDVLEVREHLAQGRDLVLDELALAFLGASLRVSLRDRQAVCAPGELIANLSSALEGSAFDRAMDALVPSLASFAIAIGDASDGRITLAQLSEVLARSGAAIDEELARLALGPDESDLEAVLSGRVWLIGRILEALRAPGADRRTADRAYDEFLEHEPVRQNQIVFGLGGGVLPVLEAIDLLANGTSGAELTRRLEQAKAVLAITAQGLTSDGDAGPRFHGYLHRYTRLIDHLGAGGTVHSSQSAR